MSILITGLSTRALAESAARGGHRVSTVDFFGDRDQADIVNNLSLKRHLGLPFSASALLEASEQSDDRGLVYTSNLENHPDVVSKLARGRQLLGNSPRALRQVRNWRTLRDFCTRVGIPFPETVLHGEARPVGNSAAWLLKPVRGGGGHGIRPWSGEPLDEAHFLQRHIKGLPASAAIVASGQNCVVLGLSEQLIGCQALGSDGYRWCGNILPLTVPPAKRASLLQAVRSMASKLTREFGLAGLNGIDLIVDEAYMPHLIEVNPRYTASMELVERATILNLFSLHLDALQALLPEWDINRQMSGPCTGKGIIFAPEPLTAPDTAGWLDLDRRDIPFPGDRIDTGHPICTILVWGQDREDCWQNLQEGARAVWSDMGHDSGGHN